MKMKHFLNYEVCGANSQAKRRSLLAGFTVLLIAVIFTLAGCGPKATPAEDFDFYQGAIVRYNGSSYDVVIPAKINGTPVTQIVNTAFYQLGRITSVIIPKGVTTIDRDAFYANKLTSVTIPNSVTYIGEYAFCHNELTSVTIPDNVTIEPSAFRENLLTSITIGNNVTLNVITNQYGVVEGPFELNEKITFENFYNENGKKAGTYTRENTDSGQWSFKAR